MMTKNPESNLVDFQISAPMPSEQKLFKLLKKIVYTEMNFEIRETWDSI